MGYKTDYINSIRGSFVADGAFHRAWVELSNAEIKALRATPKELVAAPGAGYMIEFLGAVLFLDYGSNVLTESTDNLIIQYEVAETAASAAIESTGFIDADEDAIYKAIPVAVGADMDVIEDSALELKNSGDGEFAGNAGADTLMYVAVDYMIHKVM